MSRCAHCGGPGKPYVYRGREFDGLVSCRGERLCPGCVRRVVGAADLLPIRVTVGLHSWTRRADDDRVTLRPFFLAGQERRR